jgi:3-oxoacyl-[acyl-carrier-protein] synthase I
MSALSVRSVGMVTSVGLDAYSTAAAIHAGVRNHSETMFVVRSEEPLVAAQVPLERMWTGTRRLTKLLASAILDCVASSPSIAWNDVPLLIALSERDRRGRPDDLEHAIVPAVQEELGIKFAAKFSGLLPFGKAAGLAALAHAQTLSATHGIERILVAGVDTLLTGATLAALDEDDRLLRDDNSNGFIPGEAAGCVLLDSAPPGAGGVTCLGAATAREEVTMHSEKPFRAQGLVEAIGGALLEASVDLSTCSVRLTDLSGEHYYFRETALALGRLLRSEGRLDLWHPAECTGEVGAAIGPILLGYAAVAARNHYLPGPYVLLHSSSDDGLRAAACLRVIGSTDVQ